MKFKKGDTIVVWDKANNDGNFILRDIGIFRYSKYDIENGYDDHLMIEYKVVKSLDGRKYKEETIQSICYTCNKVKLLDDKLRDELMIEFL